MTQLARCTSLLSLVLVVASGVGSAEGLKPVGLECDALTEPLGIDAGAPMLSWRLQDGRRGARQTAYEVMVYSKAPLGPGARADVWDSGKVMSGASNGVRYGGPGLRASTRYFWRVEVWDQDGKAYPVSEASWWETGLMGDAPWKGQWIGYENAELHAVRESGAAWITNAAGTAKATTDVAEPHHDFRLRFMVDRPVARAVLYATGEDAAAAWVNGVKVMEAHPKAPWGRLAWETYARSEVTAAVHAGENLAAIGVTRFRGGGPEIPTRTPMSMCLYLLFKDGTSKLYSSASPGWTAALDAPEGWWTTGYDAHTWAPAERFVAASKSFDGDEGGLPWPTGPVAALRRTFDEPKRVVSARLYATALGAYAFRMNGSPVGDQMLAPGWMDYREHVAYQVYDVTRQMRVGRNAVTALLAPGWYSTPLRWQGQGNNYGATQPALKAQLRLEHADGSVAWVGTDGTWKGATSAIAQAEIYDGETRDARLEAPGWETAGFDDRAWKAAMVVAPREPKRVAQTFPPIRVEKVMTALSVSEPRPGVYIFDFGQNMTAVPRLRVRGARGEDVQMRFAEVLNADGTLYTDNLRTAKATDHFILAGSGLEEFQPLFTFHGFRYAEITGLTAKPTAETLQAAVLHTDAPWTTRLRTGDAMVNQLYSNILWGQRSNFVGVPTDCPQRDERLGWSADAQVFWRTASYNMDLATFSQKYAGDLRGTQDGTSAMYGIYAPGVDTTSPGYGAAWSDAGVIVPWTGWMQSGRTQIIEENWDGMARYLAEIGAKNPDHLWRNGFGAAFGDWLTPTITTPEDLLATAYWAYDASLMRQMALATGRTAEAERYAGEFAAIRDAFQKAYVRADGFVGTVDRYPSIPPPTIKPEQGGEGKDRVVETQTGYVLALHMNLLPENLRGPAADRLVRKIEENHWLLGTGFVGTPYLLEVLCDTGHADVAYRLLLNREYPSWGYLIDHGATTTWERWNGDAMRGDPSMNSYNHYAYGAVGEWLYRYAAGIDTAAEGAGFRTVVLHPNFDARLGGMEFDYDSGYGTIHSGWRVESDRVTWEVVIPPNATAVLALDRMNATGFLLDGTPLERSGMVHPAAGGGYTLASGRYRFEARLKGAPAIASSEGEGKRGSNSHPQFCVSSETGCGTSTRFRGIMPL